MDLFSAGSRDPAADMRVQPRVDDRRVISGIVHVRKSGGRWVDAPPECGPRKTLFSLSLDANLNRRGDYLLFPCIERARPFSFGAGIRASIGFLMSLDLSASSIAATNTSDNCPERSRAPKMLR